MFETLQKLRSELRSGWRFRWYAVAVAWIVGLVGFAVVAWLPNVYEGSARIYVDGTSVLRPLLKDRIVPQDVETHLVYVRQALLSKEYLERVAQENGLDLATASPAKREQLLDRLKQAIVIDAVPADNKAGQVDSVFTIGYRNENRATAIAVVTTLMNRLIEDTLGENREGTDKAARFLDERIAEHEARLEKAEQALAEFQRANSGKLPGSEGGYFERMQKERDALEKTRRDLRLAQSKRDRLQKQLTSESPVTVADSATTAKEPRPDSIDARIRDQRTQLDNLLLKYTDQHPSVIAMKESLARLEAQRTEQLKALGIQNTDQQLSDLGSNPVYQAVQIALNEVDVEIASLEVDARDREQKLHDLQSLIDEVPEVEAELARLNRDYSVINEQYQALIQSRERQQLSQQASTTDQVEFRVLNPPDSDLKPVAPKRLLLLAAVLAAALGAGGALSYVLAQLRPVFTSSRSLSEVTGMPVLGSVSRVLVGSRAAARRWLAVASFTAALGALVLIIGGLALYELVGPGIHSLVGGA